MTPTEYDMSMKFLRDQCPAYQERERTLYQLLRDRHAANKIMAHKLVHAKTMDEKNDIYQQILAADRQTLVDAFKGGR